MAESKEGKETALQTGPKEGTLQWYLDKPNYKGRLDEILGKHAPEFAASLIQIASSSKQLSQAEPRSIIAAGMTAAVLRLPLDRNLGFAWIVPYNQSVKVNGKWEKHNLAQFQLGYRGYRQLAMRTGMYKDMNAGPVNAEALKGYNAVGNRIIDWEKYDDDPEKAVGYFFAWELVNGFSKLVYWPVEKIKKHAERYSQNHMYHLKDNVPFKKDCRWCSDFHAMAMKTVSSAALRAWGIMSVEMHDQMRFAIERDQTVAYDIDAEPIYMDNEDGDGGGEEPENGERANTNQADDLTAQLKANRQGTAPVVDAEAARPATEADSKPTREPGEEEPGPMGRKAAIAQIENLLAAITANNNFNGNAYDFIEQYAGKGIRKVAKIPDDKLGNVIDGLNLEKEKLQ